MLGPLLVNLRGLPAGACLEVGAILARVGTTQLTDEEFAWWFDSNPAGEGIVSLAVDRGEVVGVAAMSFFRTALDGDVTRLAIPVNVATDPRYRE